MPQVNVLPVNVSQNIELKGEAASFDVVESNDDFSQYIDQHLNKNKGYESNSQVDNAKSEVSLAKSSSSRTESTLDTKKSDDLIDNSDTSDETDSVTYVQKVAAYGNKGQTKSEEIDQQALLESEQLMSFLTKADNTLITPSVDISSSTSSPEQLSAEQKAYYEAQLLLNASNMVADLSAVTKALGKDQVSTVSEQTLIKQEKPVEELMLSNVAKAAGKEGTSVKLSVEAVKDEINNDTAPDIAVTLVKSGEKKAVLPELKTESTSEAKLINASSDKANMVKQKTTPTFSSGSLAENDLESKNNEDVSLPEEQKIAKKIKVDNAQISNEKTSQNGLHKEVSQSKKVEVLSNSQLPENEVLDMNDVSQVNRRNQIKPDTDKSLNKTNDTIEKQVNLSKEVQQEKVSSLADSQLTKSELKQNNEATTPNEVVTISKATTPNEVVTITKAAMPNNQPVSGALSDDVNKAQAKLDEKSQLSVSLAEQSQQKSSVQNENEVVVEGKTITGVKREAPVNSHFIDVSGKATQTQQHIIEQQSAEMLNPSVATEVTQSQKNNAQLHQETISLFRKDFTEAVKDKVMLMISQKLQQFDITLDPPELGNMRVRVNLQGEQAVVNFLVQSQQTKDALEQNMHKLRDLLAEQGVDVGDANVEQQSQQSSNEERTTDENNHQREDEIGNMAEANDVIAHTLSAKMIDSSTASIDYYA
jgi:flagellar hook-length control protein FliK